MNYAADPGRFAGAFAQHGIVSMANILPEDLADRMYGEFGEVDWILQIKDYTLASCLEIPLSEVPNPDNLVEVLYSRKHELDLDKLFYIRLVAPADTLKTGALKQIIAFLNSAQFISSCRAIVGMDDINRAWVEATCYDKACFLGAHMDDHHPDNRVAFVLNLTRVWKLDWGGLLLLQNDPGNPPLLLPPAWNSLTLFRIPVNHTVTSVAQHAQGHRYSITGWLRP